MERFSVVLTSSRRPSGSLLDKAAAQIYRAALLHRVAVLTGIPRAGGAVARSVIVVDTEADARYIDEIIRQSPDRFVGIYTLGARSHAELLEAITEDLEEVANGMA